MTLYGTYPDPIRDLAGNGPIRILYHLSVGRPVTYPETYPAYPRLGPIRTGGVFNTPRVGPPRSSRDEPYLPPDLDAARHETNQPEQETHA
jgi:hypothetical protein